MSTNIQETILIVDDNPANLLVLETLLTENGRTLITATSGKEALSYLLGVEVDLIILDVQMPGMDGFEVAQILKTNKRTRGIPVIFATAESHEHSMMMKGYDEGAVDYLLKPLDPDLVKAKVNVLLKIQQQKKELQDKNTSLEKFGLLIENSTDIIGIIDARDGSIEQINLAVTETLGYAVPEITGKKINDFLEIPLNFPYTPDTGGQDRFSFENEVICKNRTKKWLHWKVRTREGRWFINARDITENKIANEKIGLLNEELQKNNEQLGMANRELESFSYSVSHDLRAPLRALIGFASIIIEDHFTELNPEVQRLLGNIKDNARKMGTLIDDLLEFSRLGRTELQRSEADMHELAKLVAEECKPQWPEKATISIANLPPAAVDHGLIKQVWTNLVSNALKYSSKKESPLIEIGFDQTKQETIYFVRDNGAGFDMKYIDKLFGVFQRLHSPKQFEGTGVGLAIVYRIVNKHGGRVWAEAMENEGATFYFSIPNLSLYKSTLS